MNLSFYNDVCFRHFSVQAQQLILSQYSLLTYCNDAVINAPKSTDISMHMCRRACTILSQSATQFIFTDGLSQFNIHSAKTDYMFYTSKLQIN